MEERPPDKGILSIIGFALLFFINNNIEAQGHKIGAGLAFASVLDYNHGETGNPGVTLNTWWAINKPGTLHIVPSVSVYNRYRLATGYTILTNYLLQGDLNAQYAIFQESGIKIIGFGGGNFTYLRSDFEIVVPSGNDTISNRRDQAFGANLGAGLELWMSPKWDFNVNGKYIISKYPQWVISVQAVYYFKTRRRAYRR